jgi:hypothetical protein
LPVPGLDAPGAPLAPPIQNPLAQFLPGGPVGPEPFFQSAGLQAILQALATPGIGGGFGDIAPARFGGATRFPSEAQKTRAQKKTRKKARRQDRSRREPVKKEGSRERAPVDDVLEGLRGDLGRR